MKFKKEEDKELLQMVLEDEISDLELDEFLSVEEPIFDFSVEQWLANEHMTKEDALKERDAKGVTLRQLAEELEYPLNNPYNISRKISEEQKYSNKLGELLTFFLSDYNQLLTPDTTQSIQDQVFDYGICSIHMEQIKEQLSTIESLQENWNMLYPLLHKKATTSQPPTNVSKDELIKVYQTSQFKIKDPTIFSYNIENLIEHINNHDALRKIAPLYFYQMFTKHHSRMQKNTDLSAQAHSLWQYKEYSIEKDNGKNYKEYEKNITVFAKLISLFQKDSLVNLSLSQWGFMQLSNLTEFARVQVEEKVYKIFPFFEALMEYSDWANYEESPYQSPLWENYQITLEDIEYFRQASKYEEALDCYIAAYLNEYGSTLHERYVNCPAKELILLYKEILEASHLPRQLLPKSEKETLLFLCTIQLGLEDLVEFYSKEYCMEGLFGMFRVVGR